MIESTVAIDIETTGLDPEADAIIEVAAVRFKGARIENEWSSLVNPRRHVPEFITTLTGIDDAMLRQAPTFREVLPTLESFIQDSPVVGHNVRFDLGFLQRGPSLANNPVIDTYELASVLLPSAGRYNLGALGKELGVLLPATHRALDDARVTQAVYLRLLELAVELPIDLVRQIVRLGEPMNWDGGRVFEAALHAPPEEKPQIRSRQKKDAGPRADAIAQLEVPDTAQAVDPDEMAALLEHGGAFSRSFQTYEQRREQVQMVRAVSQALSKGHHLLVEAGTGVGKSFAYLIPAAMFALRNNTRVLISTNTINLQDQLIRKDIPDLRRALQLDVRAAVLKGRSNYLCPRRLENALRFGPRNDAEMRVLAKILVWQRQDQSGDRSAINLNGNAEREVWQRLSAEDEACTTETCMRRTGGSCPFHLARTAAQSAHVLIVNHALLLSDVAAAGKVLPEYSYLVVDEGHHLEAATTAAMSFRIDRFDMERITKELGGSTSGALGRLLPVARKSVTPAEHAALNQRVARATDLTFRVEQLVREFFERLSQFAGAVREQDQPSQYAWQARILPSTRSLPGWDPVEIAWDAAGETTRLLLRSVAELHQAASRALAEGADRFEDVVSDLGTAARRLSEAEAQISAIMSSPVPEHVYWIEVRPSGNALSLNAAPLKVAPLVEKVLWHEKASVILTSATLTTHGEFRYLRDTLGADEADELQLGSPFDYEDSTLLYVANDIGEPNSPDYARALHNAIMAAARAAGGRTLVLFTSYAALRKANQAISAPLAREDILVYEHGEGASPNVLLESFRATERAVLLGTRAFWEGVDVPGQALSVLIIPKLPFDVPSDPLIAARSETYDDPFGEYLIPEAILKFRQGFGRLIRTATDRGVVAVLDRRVLSKQYGRLFLESLPQCTKRQGSVANLGKEVSNWLATYAADAGPMKRAASRR